LSVGGSKLDMDWHGSWLQQVACLRLFDLDLGSSSFRWQLIHEGSCQQHAVAEGTLIAISQSTPPQPAKWRWRMKNSVNAYPARPCILPVQLVIVRRCGKDLFAFHGGL
jgi:hypothetical protein